MITEASAEQQKLPTPIPLGPPHPSSDTLPLPCVVARMHARTHALRRDMKGFEVGLIDSFGGSLHLRRLAAHQPRARNHGRLINKNMCCRRRAPVVDSDHRQLRARIVAIRTNRCGKHRGCLVVQLDIFGFRCAEWNSPTAGHPHPRSRTCVNCEVVSCRRHGFSFS